ncbi:unnamed protein product [Dracunculus medinensis]|uniref:Recep_L_domain domain-containing protein n=1 Tax=Dracunculus medinensis TaxID=318479 RepID=A0A0N4U7M4_DRAME|nr:unnamed protein product [Dracunculus medinensis]
MECLGELFECISDTLTVVYEILENLSFLNLFLPQSINSNSLRELTLEGKSLHIGSNVFTGLKQIDFFNIRGASMIFSDAFENVSRIHSASISLSSNEIQRIGNEAFSGLYTVARLVIHENTIENISNYAFSSIINIGELIIKNNIIINIGEESFSSPAWRTKISDNKFYCSCNIYWIKNIKVCLLAIFKDVFILRRNYCGAEEGHRTLINYSPICNKAPRNINGAKAFCKYLIFLFLMIIV